MQVKVYAKLNLTLNVGARKGEFHPVDSVATSVDVCDVVEVVARTDSQVHVSGVSQVEETHNTAYSAAHAFVEAFSTPGVDVFLQKGIPFGAGLGGSSADAAAVLQCMCKLFGVDADCEKVHELCAKLGSDVSFMLRGGLGRLLGKGDDVEYFSLKQPIYFALTTFTQEMNSREVYAAFDTVAAHCGNGASQRPFEDVRNAELLTLLEHGNVKQALDYLCNDLQQAAAALSNYADAYLKFVNTQHWRAVMTGSGSAYYVAFATRAEAQKAVDLLNSNSFTTILCQTVPHGVEFSTI